MKLQLLSRVRDKVEPLWLKRWYRAPRMEGTKLDIRLDLATPSGQVRGEADFSFRPRVTSARMACGMGAAKIHSATWNGKPVKARVNAPYLVLKFPEKLEAAVETRVQLKYTYYPDRYWTIRQPVTGGDFPVRLWLTCRRPLLAVSQGELVKGEESPPLRTYEWRPPRSRKLNAIVANVRSFKKETPAGMSIWLHLHADGAARAPRILDLLIDIYVESVQNHRRELPYTDLHVVEADERDVVAFCSPGLIVVPRGSFSVDDKPRVYGLLAAELNKEWGREALRLHAPRP